MRIPNSRKGKTAKQRAGLIEAVAISKKLRMEWTDALATDPEVTPTMCKVGCVIGSHVNRHTGDTFLSQVTISNAVGLCERVVRDAIKSLEALGYLIVRRREIKVREADGKRFYGGRGVANVYLPAFDRLQVTTFNAGRRLAGKADEAWQAVHDRAAGNDPKVASGRHQLSDGGGTGVPPLDDESRHADDVKPASACRPTLSNPSDYNPSRERKRAREDLPASSLGNAEARLRLRIGDQAFESWFSRGITIESNDGNTLIIGTPSRFVRDWVSNHYALKALEAWHDIDPGIQRIEFVVRL